MRARPGETQLAFQQAGAAARVDHPSGGALARPAGGRQRNPVGALFERDGQHPGVVQHLGARFGNRLEEHVLQATPIELERRHGSERRVSKLDPGRDVGIAVTGEEIAEPQLLELSAAQVRFEPEDLLKVVGADLDTRLAHLEGGLSHGMLALFDDEHAERRGFQIQLTGKCGAGQAAADDYGIVIGIAVRFHHHDVPAGYCRRALFGRDRGPSGDIEDRVDGDAIVVLRDIKCGGLSIKCPRQDGLIEVLIRLGSAAIHNSEPLRHTNVD